MHDFHISYAPRDHRTLSLSLCEVHFAKLFKRFLKAQNNLDL